jgi:hypothetical protein
MKRVIAGLAGLWLTAPIAHATTVAQLNLADLSSHAGRIFRGTVVHWTTPEEERAAFGYFKKTPR